MSLETELEREVNVEQYQSLKSFIPRLEKGTQDFMDLATALHGRLTDPAEKQEVIDRRDELVLKLRTILGV